MGIYATVDQLRAYADLVGGDDGDLELVIERAERQIDSLLGPWPLQANGRKMGAPTGVNELDLTPDQANVLSAATCAQAEYRIQMGEPFFVKAQRTKVSGPEFTTEGKLPRIGPKVADELLAAPELRLRTARASA